MLATGTYSGAWDATGRRRLAVALLARADRAIAGETQPASLGPAAEVRAGALGLRACSLTHPPRRR